MKHFLLSLALLVGISAFSQSSSKRDPQYKIDFAMELKKPGSWIMISTYKSATEQDKSLVLQTSSADCIGLKGVRIRLANGDNLIFDDVEIECGPYAPDRSNVSATLPLTEELEAKLDGQEIYEFTLGNIKTPVKFKERYENLVSLFKWVKDERGF